MSAVFVRLVNMSISASYLVLAVIALRLLLKRAPKWLTCLLWALVAVRLVCPFSLESTLSLIPSAQTIPPRIEYAQNPAIQSGIPAINSAVNPAIAESFTPNPANSVNPLQVVLFALSILWLIGVCTMLLYALISYLRLRKTVAPSFCLRGNVYEVDGLPSPFILGLFRPRIYVPSQMDASTLDYVVRHEKAHLLRRDHWWKPFGYLLLAVHWFNPLLWVAYVLLCRNIELACDEKVVRSMDDPHKAAYSQALLSASLPRHRIAACPLAFGEVGLKQRVKSILHYKKPAFWLVLAAVLICIAAAVCFLTDPLPQKDSLRFVAQERPLPDVQRADFELSLGRRVQSAAIRAEQWQNGICVSGDYLHLGVEDTDLHVQFVQHRADDLSLGSFEVQLEGDPEKEKVVVFFSAPTNTVGWAFTSYEEGERLQPQPGDELILAALVYDEGGGVRALDCETYTNEPERLQNAENPVLVIRAVFSAEANGQASALDAPDTLTPQAERPCLYLDGALYVNPYMGVQYLPQGYRSAGLLSEEQAYNTDLAGSEYFTRKGNLDDFYVYQLCATPIDANTVDSENRRWAYMRYIRADGELYAERRLTLDDVLLLSQKGQALGWADFDPYTYEEVGSGLYIRAYEIDPLYRLFVGGGGPQNPPMYISLIYLPTSENVEVREGDVQAFLTAHGAGKAITIHDRTAEEGLVTADALEPFWRDENTEYLFTSVMSQYVTAILPDGTELPVTQALEEGYITPADLDAAGISYYTQPYEPQGESGQTVYAGPPQPKTAFERPDSPWQDAALENVAAAREDFSAIFLELDGQQLYYNADEAVVKQAADLLLSAHALGYEPKTHNINHDLRLVFMLKDGTGYALDLDLVDDLYYAGGEFYDYGEPDAAPALKTLWDTLELPAWPDAVQQKYAAFFQQWQTP